jgi:dienelactone hydrolase
MATSAIGEAVQIPDGSAILDGDLHVPQECSGLVIFAHGSGSGRFSPRNRRVAHALESAGFATLLLDLLTRAEEAVDAYTREYRFDIERLGRRVVAAVDWTIQRPELRDFRIGYFGASTGAAAALIAAAERPDQTAAVVSRGGRPDLAGSALRVVRAPTLLIVGGDDAPVIQLNEEARGQMRTTVRLEIVPGATHLFEEPGALEEVQRLAIDWFRHYLPHAAGHHGAVELLDGVGPDEI